MDATHREHGMVEAVWRSCAKNTSELQAERPQGSVGASGVARERDKLSFSEALRDHRKVVK